MTSIIAWIRQPTTIAGLATVAYVIAGLVSKHLTMDAAWPLLSGAAVALGIKDNTSTILHQSQANGAAVGAVVPETAAK